MPVRFSLGGYRGPRPEAAGYPRVQAAAAAATASRWRGRAKKKPVFEYERRSGRYWLLWKTDRRWAGSCREFVLKLDDGSVHTRALPVHEARDTAAADDDVGAEPWRGRRVPTRVRRSMRHLALLVAVYALTAALVLPGTLLAQESEEPAPAETTAAEQAAPEPAPAAEPAPAPEPAPPAPEPQVLADERAGGAEARSRSRSRTPSRPPAAP